MFLTCEEHAEETGGQTVPTMSVKNRGRFLDAVGANQSHHPVEYDSFNILVC